MKKQTTNHAAEKFHGFANSISYTLNELCAGQPENRFDAWLRKRFYPILAVWHEIPLGINEEMYERRLAELMEGKPENKYDAWLRDRFYPIVACFTIPDTYRRKMREALKDDEVLE